MTEPVADSAEQAPPKIEFPCDYPIKVVGHAAEDFQNFVIEVMQRHSETVMTETISMRASGNGNFVAVTITIQATGIEQLQRIHEELKASGRVHMVL
jgi:putative lipoic acid-binding regulatory protein